MIPTAQVTGVILSGGKSRRMGTDKALLPYQGAPFIANVIAALRPLVTESVIVSDHVAHDGFNCTRIPDLIYDQGPLVGIYTALIHIKTPYALVVSCDAPKINTSALNFLVSEDLHAAVRQLTDGDNISPLLALYHRDKCLIAFKRLIEKGERRLIIALDA